MLVNNSKFDHLGKFHWLIFFFSFLPLDFRLALIQLHVSAVKSDNIQRACGLVREASAKGAKVVALPVSKDHDLLKIHTPQTLGNFFVVLTMHYIFLFLSGCACMLYETPKLGGKNVLMCLVPSTRMCKRRRAGGELFVCLFVF